MGSTRVVWCREKGSGARTGNSQKPGLTTGLFVSFPGIGILSRSFVRHGSVVTAGFDIGLVGLTVDLRHPRQVPREKPGGRLYGRSAPQARDGWNGLPAQTSPLQEKDRGMENFFLFVLSSSFCTLVASVTLLLRPLVGLP
jgi:hypothetical protein